MRRIVLASLLAAAAPPALASGELLKGEAIRTALSGGLFRHADNTRTVLQSFNTDGRTFYYEGSQQSEGRWEVRKDKYCAQWPPSETWVCYRVEDEGGVLTFVSQNGSRYPVVRVN